MDWIREAAWGFALGTLVGVAIIVWRKNRKFPATICGHMTKATERIRAFGDSHVIRLFIQDGKAGYCHRCLEKMTIRCACCGRAIFVGQEVTLYQPKPEDVEYMPVHAVLDSRTNAYVACYLSDCAGNLIDPTGRWMPPGEIHHFVPLRRILLIMRPPEIQPTFNTDTAQSEGSRPTLH